VTADHYTLSLLFAGLGGGPGEVGDGLGLLRIVGDVQQLGEGRPGEVVRSEPALPRAVVEAASRGRMIVRGTSFSVP
jgi:hypothetical protein